MNREFGSCKTEESFYGERVSYTSKTLDEDTGLYYFNARWYDPNLGRFITEDPIKDGNNWYAYAGNNPIMNIDPTGLYILKTRRAFNSFDMNSAGTNLGISSTPVSVAGCFAVSYAREANTWLAYKYEQNGETISENINPWMNYLVDSYHESNFSKNPGEEDLILRNTRIKMHESVFGSIPEVAIIDGEEQIIDTLNLINESEDPFTIIGIVETSSGVHAFNIDGFDAETGMVSGYDTLPDSQKRDSFPVSDLKEIRPMTITKNEFK